MSEEWKNWFAPNCSPYFAMYRCGLAGISIDEVLSHTQMLGLPIRQKDLDNYANGKWKRSVSRNGSRSFDPVIERPATSLRVRAMSFNDFEQYPSDHVPTELRWFPCTSDNKPMQKWGYKDGFIPTLYTRQEAQALSECGWVGQNMLGQRFIVIDIDGVGHGCVDEKVIAFGNKYRHYTEVWEDPNKVGSFHLYFWTDRKMPVLHYPKAKLDFMGNAVNAAVYTKNKQSNGVPRSWLTAEIWQDLMSYVKGRENE